MVTTNNRTKIVIQNKAMRLKIGFLLCLVLSVFAILWGIFGEYFPALVNKYIWGFIFIFVLILVYIMNTASKLQRFVFDSKGVTYIELYYGIDGYSNYKFNYLMYDSAIIALNHISIKKKNGKIIFKTELAPDFTKEQKQILLHYFNDNKNKLTSTSCLLAKTDRKLEL